MFCCPVSATPVCATTTRRCSTSTGQLVARWDASVGKQPVDVSGDLQKLAMDTVGLAGFGARFDSYDHDGLAPMPQSFTDAFGELVTTRPHTGIRS